MPNPYINPAMQVQDLSGLNPVYQNMAAQQQFQNQAAMQGQQLAQQAGQTAQQSNPMALAAALRKPTDPNAPTKPTTWQNLQNMYASYSPTSDYNNGGDVIP